MNAEPKSEAVTAPTVTASESENPVDQNQVADSASTVVNSASEGNDGVTGTLAAYENDDTIVGSPASPSSVSYLPEPSDQWEQVDESDAPFIKRGPGRPRKTNTAETTADKIVRLPLNQLLPHPLNKKLFGETSPDEITKLAESIATTGQLSPLIVTADLGKVGYYTLLSGHKRADALRSLGRTEANCQVADVKDADERLLRLVEANRQHVPTTVQKIRIGEMYFELETKKAKARQMAGAKSAKKGSDVVEVVTQPSVPPDRDSGTDATGKARDLAAVKVGMSGVSFDKGRKVLRAVGKAESEGRKESAAKLLELLNGNGIDPAYEHAKVLHPGRAEGGSHGGTHVPSPTTPGQEA